jgi:phage tail-like protein
MTAPEDKAAPPPPPPPPPGPPPAFKAPSRVQGVAANVTAGALLAQKAIRERRAETAAAADFTAAAAFAFRVVFGEGNLKDETSFQDVSGIGAEMQTEEVEEGGETRYVQRLPKGVKYNPLVLKRGIGPAGSPLVQWCRATLEGGLGRQIRTVPLTVYLLDADQAPLRAWLFADAYPTQWEVGGFDAMKNELVIETIKLSFTYSNRIL